MLTMLGVRVFQNVQPTARLFWITSVAFSPVCPCVQVVYQTERNIMDGHGNSALKIRAKGMPSGEPPTSRYRGEYIWFHSKVHRYHTMVWL
jgi:hypothetical protein